MTFKALCEGSQFDVPLRRMLGPLAVVSALCVPVVGWAQGRISHREALDSSASQPLTVIRCPAEFELPPEALAGDWVTRALDPYRCEFHGDVAIRQVRIVSRGNRIQVDVSIWQDKGKDKEVDLELRIYDEREEVRCLARRTVELDEGKSTVFRMKLQCDEHARRDAARVGIVIHSIAVD